MNNNFAIRSLGITASVRKFRILYIDETTGFGGGMVALRNLIAGLDPTRFSAAVAVRADNTVVRHYLAETLPPHVRVFPIRRLSLSFLEPSVRKGLFTLLGTAGLRLYALAERSKWALRVLLDSLPAAVQMAAIAKCVRADAIHTNEQLTTNIGGIIAAWLVGIPCFCHNRMWGFSAGLVKRLLPFVTHCFAVSEFIKKDMIARGVPASLVSVVHDGLDLERGAVDDSPPAAIRKDLGIAKDRCVVGIFGRVIEWKGHEFFLKALALASRQAPNLFGLIVGDTTPPNGPLMKFLQRRVSELGLADRVRFTGYRTDVTRLMAASDLIVVPSVEPDPFPAVNLEAMAVSRPVIATRVGGIPEVVKDGENGLLIEPGDVEGFANAILRLCSDRDLAERLGRQGRQLVEQKFTHKRYAEEVMREYLRILETRR